MTKHAAGNADAAEILGIAAGGVAAHDGVSLVIWTSEFSHRRIAQQSVVESTNILAHGRGGWPLGAAAYGTGPCGGGALAASLRVAAVGYFGRAGAKGRGRAKGAPARPFCAPGNTLLAYNANKAEPKTQVAIGTYK